jgi:aminomethyltransferase
MLNESGGVIDDLITYRRGLAGINGYRVIVNAATRDKDLQWMREVGRAFEVDFQVRDDLVMLAVQGPKAFERASPLLPPSLAAAVGLLGAFHAVESNGVFLARTGYTGEEGWEILLPAEEGVGWWDGLLAAGVVPCGLGARDTLRLEAGMNLYGQDMDEMTSPLVSGLAWTVAWEPASREFIGRGALERERAAGPVARLAGVVLAERGVMRREQHVLTGAGEGRITSGGFSPTMNCSIALARVPRHASGDCQVEIRGVMRSARLVRPPFVRHGQVLVA